jgi:hypothetical protein
LKEPSPFELSHADRCSRSPGMAAPEGTVEPDLAAIAF